MDKWEEKRAQGKALYIVKEGVLKWGVSTAALFSIFMLFMVPQNNVFVLPLISFILFPLGGIAFGFLTWHLAEKKYQATQNNKQ